MAAMQYKTVRFDRKTIIVPATPALPQRTLTSWDEVTLTPSSTAGISIGGELVIGPVPTFDPGQLLTTKYGAEGWLVGGFHMSPDGLSMFVLLQRPKA